MAAPLLTRLWAGLFGRGERLPYPRARAALTLAGCALVALDMLVAALPDSAMGGRGAGIPVVFWASAAVCFICSFVLSMTEEAP